jgi:hypothetical protein
METKPTHEQAQLQLKLYDLRREERLRKARDWFFRNYFAETMDEVQKVAPMGSEQGVFVMMVVSYWDQACAMLNYGLLHEDLFFEHNGEFVGVWERLKPVADEARQRFVNKQFAAHLQKAAERFEQWSEKRSPGQMTAMRQMMKQMRAQQSAAKA